MEENASLTLKNVNLTVGADRTAITDSDMPHFELGITVNQGGALFMDGCAISNEEYGSGFQITCLGNNIFELKNCRVDGCGNEWWYGGIQIRDSEHVVIQNNVITESIVDLFNCTGGEISGNTISNSLYAVNLEGSSNIIIKDNVVQNSIDGFVFGKGENILIREMWLPAIGGM